MPVRVGPVLVVSSADQRPIVEELYLGIGPAKSAALVADDCTPIIIKLAEVAAHLKNIGRVDRFKGRFNIGGKTRGCVGEVGVIGIAGDAAGCVALSVYECGDEGGRDEDERDAAEVHCCYLAWKRCLGSRVVVNSSSSNILKRGVALMQVLFSVPQTPGFFLSETRGTGAEFRNIS